MCNVHIGYIVGYCILYDAVEDETIGEITTVSGGQSQEMGERNAALPPIVKYL